MVSHINPPDGAKFLSPNSQFVNNETDASAAEDREVFLIKFLLLSDIFLVFKQFTKLKGFDQLPSLVYSSPCQKHLQICQEFQ